MSKQKAQGTRYESAVVAVLARWLATWGGDPVSARRIAEGGSADEGDVEAFLFGLRVVSECKSRQTLQVQGTLAKAKQKAGDVPVLLWWKRLTRTAGNTRRTPVAGISEVVVATPNDLYALLHAAYTAGVAEGRKGVDGA